VAHSLNIPAPFGGTPLFERYLKGSRILTALPFTFYCKPHLATTVKNYTPIAFYEKLMDIFTHMTSLGILAGAVRTSENNIFKAYHPIRNLSLRLMLRTMGQILALLRTDRAFRAFHEGESPVLPEYYHRKYEALLGPYKGLISREERYPVMHGIPLNGKQPGPYR
jgi:hypothetical protein